MPHDPVTSDSSAPGAAPSVLLRRALDSWRRELTELAGPDTLLAYRDLPLGTLDLGTAHPSGLAGFLAGRPTRLSDLFREQTALATARERARYLRLAATRLTDVYGLPGSRLAVGLVEWTRPADDQDDSASDGPVAPTTVTAPVLLRPLVLRPRGSGAVDVDLDLDGPPRLNPSLLRLLHARGVTVDEDEILGLAGDDHGGFTPRRVLDRLRDLLADVPGTQVHDRTVVGLFTDLGPALVADLDDVAPDLAGHRFVQALLGSGSIGGASEAPGGVRSPTSGPVKAPRDGELVALDPSQRAVVEAVAHGRDVRVEAPVGSGATQVAAQLVIDAARTGRSMLVVAPRRGPLDDVRARLAAHGLDQLLPVQTALGPEPDGGSDENHQPATPAAPAAQLSSPQRDLAARQSLHAVRPRWGTSRLTVLEALVRLTPPGTAPADPEAVVSLPTETLQRLTPAGARAEAAALLMEAADAGAFSPTADTGPWAGAAVRSAEDADDAIAAVDRVRGALPDVGALQDGLTRAAGLRTATTVSEWVDQTEFLVSVRATLDQLLPAAYQSRLDDPIAATGTARWREEHDVRMSWLERRRWRRQGQELVRPGMKPDDLHAALVTARSELRRWQRLSGTRSQPRVPHGLAAADAALRAVVADLDLLDDVVGGTSGGAGLFQLPLEELATRLDELAETRDELAAQPRRETSVAALDGLGLSAVVARLRDDGAGCEEVTERLERTWLLGVLAAMDSEDETLGRDDDRRDGPASRPPAVPGTTAVAVPSLAVPMLFGGPTEASSRRPFDTVLLLDAQRMGLAEAVLAVARGRQVVVLGDPQGLRPATLDALDEAPGQDDEGSARRTCVLDATTGRLLTLALDHRHRSPEQVVAISQALTAGSAPLPRWQVAAPAVAVARLELVQDGVVPVAATPDEASPPQEVHRVVELVVEHVRHRPEESLAVLALGRGHARVLADAVRRALSDQPELMSWFARPAREPFVVTDVARAEDTVRDHVLLALGLGRTPHGRVVHRFGRLDAEGGDRLLGLGVAQARHRLTVVSSLAADDLDPERTSSDGARAVRRLLQVLSAAPSASDGPSAAAPLGPAPAGSGPLLDLLVSTLHDAGFEVGSPEGAVAQDVSQEGEGVDLEFEPAAPTRSATRQQTSSPQEAARSADLLVRVPGGPRTVAVLWDGRRRNDDPGDVVADDAMLSAALRRFGWGVAHVRSVDVVTDPEAVVEQVSAAAAPS